MACHNWHLCQLLLCSFSTKVSRNCPSLISSLDCLQMQAVPSGSMTCRAGTDWK